jgi:hypothetical protein
MYSPPEVIEHTEEWIEAERSLALNSFEFASWLVQIQPESAQNDDSGDPITPENQ